MTEELLAERRAYGLQNGNVHLAQNKLKTKLKQKQTLTLSQGPIQTIFGCERTTQRVDGNNTVLKTMDFFEKRVFLGISIYT